MAKASGVPTPIAASVAPVLLQVNVTVTAELLVQPTEVLFAGENVTKAGPVATGGGDALGAVLGAVLGEGDGLGELDGDADGVSLGDVLGRGVGWFGVSLPEISRVRMMARAMSNNPPMIDSTMRRVRDFFSGSCGGPPPFRCGTG